MITLIGIPFEFMGMSYYRTDKDVNIGDFVVVTTPHGTYTGKIARLRKASEEELARKDFETVFPVIDRIATFRDRSSILLDEERGKEITKKTQELSDQLKLGMKVLRSYLDCNGDKVLVTFTSEGRVDFRELVKILNGMLHLKIELRQIGPRDQARLVGGIGPCGLPLCCTTFLTSFDGISIAMAKNQLLTINIPKLSGQCGKLMCCLKFEDQAYAELRPLYPKIGEKFTYMNKQYEVTGLNLLNDTITTYNGDNYESFSKAEYERVKSGLAKVDENLIKASKDVNSGVDLSGYGISDTNNRIAQIKKNEDKRKEEFENKNKNKNNFNKNNKHNNQKGKTFTGSNSHAFNKGNNNSYNKNKNTFNKNNNQNKPSSSSSGFIPVSQIADKSILDFKPVKKDDKE